LRKFLPIVVFFAAIAHAESLPEGPGKAATEKVCSDCHGPDLILSMGGADRAAWKEVVDDMVTRGAKATDAQVKEIVDYLAKNFPKK